MRKARRSPRIERSRHRCRGGCHFSDHDQLINAALAAWFGASEERPRMSSERVRLSFHSPGVLGLTYEQRKAPMRSCWPVLRLRDNVQVAWAIPLLLMAEVRTAWVPTHHSGRPLF